MHQLPATPSVLRVRTWRRLQQLGAVALKQAVYVLPDSAEAREDFEWLKAEIEGAGGEAAVLSADSLDRAADEALVEEFRRLRQSAYTDLAVDIQQTHRSKPKGTRGAAQGPHARRLLARFRDRLSAIERIDFFGSAGRDRVVTLLTDLEGRSPSGSPSNRPPSGGAPSRDQHRRGRLWVTRPRPGVDRMASAWLIRRFIDPDARFGFVTDAKAVPSDAEPFDMYGVDLSHHGDHCTFETLCERFGIREAAVARLAEIVHDLDLKDRRFGAADVPTVGALIDGLQLAYADDTALLEQGMTLFESLYRAFAQSGRIPGPTPVARRRPTASRPK